MRFEGISERYLEIDGAWEDHARYAITAEEWGDRAPELVSNWLFRDTTRRPRNVGRFSSLIVVVLSEPLSRSREA